MEMRRLDTILKYFDIYLICYMIALPIVVALSDIVIPNWLPIGCFGLFFIFLSILNIPVMVVLAIVVLAYMTQIRITTWMKIHFLLIACYYFFMRWWGLH